MDNKDLPINPCRIDNIGGEELQYTGLTKREYFASMALQGLLANPNPHNLPFGKGQRITNIAFQCSDDLIKELVK